MAKRIHIDNGHFYVCFYCANLILGDVSSGRFGEGPYYYCEKRKDEKGKYIELGNTLLEGSEDFVPSGLPAHPRVLKELVKINPKCSSISSDPNATESGYDFDDKVTKYMRPENIRKARDLW